MMYLTESMNLRYPAPSLDVFVLGAVFEATEVLFHNELGPNELIIIILLRSSTNKYINFDYNLLHINVLSIA